MPKTPRERTSVQVDDAKLRENFGSRTAVIPSEKNADTSQTPVKQKTAFEQSAKGENMSLLDQIMVHQEESVKSGGKSQKSVKNENSGSFLKKRKSTIPNNQDIQATLGDDPSPI